MIVLDTNVISEIFRPHPEPRVIAWLESIVVDVAMMPSSSPSDVDFLNA